MNKMEDQSQVYVAPVVEVLEVQVEKGFAASVDQQGQLPGWEVE